MPGQPPLFTGSEQVVRVATSAFDLLLRHGRPAAVPDVAATAGLGADGAEEAVREAAATSRLRRLADGRVHGVLGLDVLPTGHHLVLEGRGLRYTWCALDLLGIVGALGAGGDATSVNPWTGTPVRLRFDAGRVAGGDRAVLFLAERSDDARPEDWCPSVNFFHSAGEARAWGEAFGVRGETLEPAEGLEMAAPRWREVLGR